MAAGRLPAPGTDLGPCPEPPGCQHRDCAETRHMATSACEVCGQPIGYEIRFYVSDAAAAPTYAPYEATTRPLVHAACLEDRLSR